MTQRHLEVNRPMLRRCPSWPKWQGER